MIRIPSNQVLVEKLLYECPGIKKIYILMRCKGDKNQKQRLFEFTRSPYFEKSAKANRVSQSVLNQKIEAVSGDITLPGLGLNDEDRDKLLKNVSIVFHSAATVRFDDPLR